MPAVFAQARALGILLIPAAEMRIEGADVVLLNIEREEGGQAVRTFDDLRALRAVRGETLLTFAPHPFYRVGGSIGQRIMDHLDCFDAIEHCHFHVPFFNPNKPAVQTGPKYRQAAPGHLRHPPLEVLRSKLLPAGPGRIGGQRTRCRQRYSPPSAPNASSGSRPPEAGPVCSPCSSSCLLVHPVLTRLPRSKRVRARRSGGKMAADAGRPNP